jgi:hypothetical protein
MSSPFDWINSINYTKENLLESRESKEYVPFIANKSLSHFNDTILIVNEMNIRPNLDKDMQYTFLLNIVRKAKRFSPWQKKDISDDLKYIKKYYNYSNEKAYQALQLLSKEQITYIKNKLENFELESK